MLSAGGAAHKGKSYLSDRRPSLSMQAYLQGVNLRQDPDHILAGMVADGEIEPAVTTRQVKRRSSRKDDASVFVNMLQDRSRDKKTPSKTESLTLVRNR